MVQAADHHGPRHPEPLTLSPQRGGRGIDVVNCRHDEQCRVRRAQPGAQFADEIRVARGVDQVQFDPPTTTGTTENDTERCWWIADGSESLTVVPSAIGALAGNRAGRGEQRLGQHRLAGIPTDPPAQRFGFLRPLRRREPAASARRRSDVARPGLFAGTFGPFVAMMTSRVRIRHPSSLFAGCQGGLRYRHTPAATRQCPVSASRASPAWHVAPVGIRPTDQLAQHRRDDLPGHAIPVLEPAASAFRPPSVSADQYRSTSSCEAQPMTKDTASLKLKAGPPFRAVKVRPSISNWTVMACPAGPGPPSP